MSPERGGDFYEPITAFEIGITLLMKSGRSQAQLQGFWRDCPGWHALFIPHWPNSDDISSSAAFVIYTHTHPKRRDNALSHGLRNEVIASSEKAQQCIFLGRKNVNISTVRGSWYLIQLGKFAPMALALTWVRNRAVGQTRSHSAERRPMLQCTPSLSSSVPRAFSPPPRWLVLADPPPVRPGPTGSP